MCEKVEIVGDARISICDQFVTPEWTGAVTALARDEEASGTSHPRNFVCSCRSHRPFVRSRAASRFVTSISGSIPAGAAARQSAPTWSTIY